MNIKELIKGHTDLLGSWLTIFIVAFVANNFLDSKFAHADDMVKELARKANVVDVSALQQAIIQDKIYELELREFKLNRMADRSDLDDFELSKTVQRLGALRKQVLPEFTAKLSQ